MKRALPWLFVPMLALTACSTPDGDLPKEPSVPSPAGTANRIREIGDPNSDAHAATNTQVSVSGVTVVAIDNFDETKDGKSRGSIYVQDLDSSKPYSGIGLYNATFVPSDLRVAPGDVLDMHGEYQENDKIGTTVDFNKGLPEGSPRQFLPQIASPTATFRFESTPPKATNIDWNDFSNFNKGRQWVGMLVTAKDIVFAEGLYAATSGRFTANILGEKNGALLSMSNELMELDPAMFPAGTKIKSLTGVVTYFFSFHIAPRSLDDIVIEK